MEKKRKDLSKMVGHRQRLRERFLNGGLDGFLDYEIVELLLTLGTPRKDCKEIAKKAVGEFGGLRNALDANYDDLQKIKGIGPSNAFGIKLFQAVSERLAREKIPEKITLDSPKAVANYLQKSIGREKKEHFVMLSLNTQNQLIKVSSISVGILDASLVHPREVFYEAIQASASQIIVAHNHPSGSTEPSLEDIEVSKQLIKTGKILGIDVLDHIIVSKNSYKSLKEADLL
jgi:DNA repair protein RadC